MVPRQHGPVVRAAPRELDYAVKDWTHEGKRVRSPPESIAHQFPTPHYFCGDTISVPNPRAWETSHLYTVQYTDDNTIVFVLMVLTRPTSTTITHQSGGLQTRLNTLRKSSTTVIRSLVTETIKSSSITPLDMPMGAGQYLRFRPVACTSVHHCGMLSKITVATASTPGTIAGPLRTS